MSDVDHFGNIGDLDEAGRFDEFEDAVLAAVERDDLAAACATMFAATDDPGAMRHLRTLPGDVRRHLAVHCLELYRTAGRPEGRAPALTVHSALQGGLLDFMVDDGFETEVQALLEQEGAKAAFEVVLATKDVPRAAERLLILSDTCMRLLCDYAESQAKTAEARERREAGIWLYARLAKIPYHFRRWEQLSAVMREVVARVDSPECQKLSTCDWPRTSALRELPRQVRRRLARDWAELYRTAGTAERREAALWMCAAVEPVPARPSSYKDHAVNMIRAVAEADDIPALCELVLTHTWSLSYVLQELPQDTQDRLAAHCVELYATAGRRARRDRVVKLHAVLSAGRKEDLKASDSMSADRHRLIEELRGRLEWFREGQGMAWLELLSGRDLPVSVGAELRRVAYGPRRSYGRRAVDAARLLVGRHPALNAGEQWSDRVLAELAELPEAWRELVEYAVTVPDSRISPAWEEKGRALLARVDAAEFRDRVLSWLPLVGGPATAPREQGSGDFDLYNYEAARGLLWLLSFLPEDPRTTRVVGAVLEKALRKRPGVGPGMPKLANACAKVLCAMEEEAALGELARLTTRVTYKSTLKILEAGLKARADALGIGRDDIEELAVPTYELGEDGRRTVSLGEVRAELAVEDGRAVLRWWNAAGKAVKSVPAAVRRDHAEEVKELKASVKDINGTLSAVSKRLDRQFLTGRTWPFATWRERYLDHPLVGTLARRLIWILDGTACQYRDGALRDLSGEPVTGESTSTVRLWHPVDHSVEEVPAWRELLEQQRVTQPFKQAHREVYLLTDAERRTATYSNRFAGHILRQYPFRSLVADRGWRDELRICHHHLAHPPAVRELPEWGLRAEYWVRGEGTVEDHLATDSGAYELLAADQVRFYPIAAAGHLISTMGDGGFYAAGPGERVPPVPLEEIPAQVLSEVLRDVDLFVGVSSIAHDPNWQDGGPGGQYAEYWSTFDVGELSGTALTRRDLLARMLPRLAFGDRCHVEGRFLHVKGELHTYKIHLGSGNILIAPGDRYLCIVAKDAPASSSSVYLPFEGDQMLSLILSKAMMLANDTKITDPSILSQFGRV